MNVNIASFEEEMIDGYKNIDYHEINQFFPGQLDNLRICLQLEYIPDEEIDNFINDAVSKIKIGGKLYLTCIDVDELAENISKLDVDEINHILYGVKRKNQNIFRLSIIKSLVKGYNFKIDFISIDKSNYTFTIVGEKNESI